MKKLVGILGALVIVLGGLLIFEYTKESREETKVQKEVTTTVTIEETETKSDDSKGNYQFKDIEKMEKATSVKEAFERIFGKDRLFDDFKDSDSYSDYEKSNFDDPFNGKIKYYLKGVYDFENIPIDDRFKYFPEKKYFFDTVSINIAMERGIDTRKEMIDFLHYLQFSGLTKPHIISKPLPVDSVKINTIHPVMPEEIQPFNIKMRVYQPIKKGMNMTESHQEWSINSDVIEVMDFSDKETMLGEIHRYGKFKGVNPSGMK